MNTYITQMQQQPRVASNGITVALRRMQVTIGKAIGTQIPVEVRYLAEQQQGAQWIPCTQDAQSLLFDTTSRVPGEALSMAGDMHAELFGGGVLQVKNGTIVVARKTFTITGAGTFQVADLNPDDKGDYWNVTVNLQLITIFNRKIKFHVDGGKWVELGLVDAKKGISVTLKHSKGN